jgi:hypothetical protein
MPMTISHCLEYAIYHSQLPPFIRTLLEEGAELRLRTQIDNNETPREIAAGAGYTLIAERLAAAEPHLDMPRWK